MSGVCAAVLLLVVAPTAARRRVPSTPKVPSNAPNTTPAPRKPVPRALAGPDPLEGAYPPDVDLLTQEPQNPHTLPPAYHLRVPRPEGWGAEGCGIGPPPRHPRIPEVCRGVVEAYLRDCGPSATFRPAGEGGWEWTLANCSDSIRNWEAGKPVYVVYVATRLGGGRSCGPTPRTYDVLDVRVDSQSSVETATTHSPYPWLQIVAFRPQSAAVYRVYVRTHLTQWEGRWHFPPRPVLPGQRILKYQKLPMSNVTCRTSPCEQRGKPYTCGMTEAPFVVKAYRNECTRPTRPSCHDTPPTVPGAWYGRWVKQCIGEESCNAH
eukprot:Hpha_TRINITY_DN6748_c0_g1::TRINITY_DN6748_c0_g1_i1::g.111012::m.111012